MIKQMDTPEKPKIFSLPEEGKLNLPVIELSSNKTAEQAVLKAVAEGGKANDFLELIPSENFWQADFGEKGIVYIKPYLQRTLYIDGPRESQVLYTADLDESGKVLGMTSSVYHYEKDKENEPPFVAMNHTEAGFHGRGLGLRRLLVLNEACRQYYDTPLISGVFVDESPENPAVKIWESLVRSGLAAKTADGYTFIK
jgi:hypothetical protein